MTKKQIAAELERISNMQSAIRMSAEIDKLYHAVQDDVEKQAQRSVGVPFYLSMV